MFDSYTSWSASLGTPKDKPKTWRQRVHLVWAQRKHWQSEELSLIKCPKLVGHHCCKKQVWICHKSLISRTEKTAAPGKIQSIHLSAKHAAKSSCTYITNYRAKKEKKLRWYQFARLLSEKGKTVQDVPICWLSMWVETPSIFIFLHRVLTFTLFHFHSLKYWNFVRG